MQDMPEKIKTYVKTEEMQNVEDVISLIKMLQPQEQQRLKDMLIGMQFAKSFVSEPESVSRTEEVS